MGFHPHPACASSRGVAARSSFYSIFDKIDVVAEPDDIQGKFELAQAHHRAGRLSDAVRMYHEIVQKEPGHLNAMHMLGLVLYQAQLHEMSLKFLRQALTGKPNDPGCHVDYGLVLAATGQIDAAMDEYHRAISLQPDCIPALNNLANLLQKHGSLDEAIGALSRVVAINPNLAEPHNNLGNALRETGDLDGAIKSFERAEAINPLPQFGSNRLFAMMHHPGIDAQQLTEAHAQWNRRYAGNIKPIACSRDHLLPDHRLRVGYVSPDFHDHPISRFFLPLLGNHARDRFEIFCYSDSAKLDQVSSMIASKADAWRNVATLSGEQLARQICEDRIDVLVDLAKHTDAKILLACAHRPAPLQISYLAYCGPTGLSAMDYYLTDSHIDPPLQDVNQIGEKPLLLETFWCYAPPEEAPEVNALPALSNGFVTYGCLNHFCKITEPTLHTWREILKKIPHSKLLLHSPPGSHRQRIIDFFAEAEIDSHQLEFVPRMPLRYYLQQYGRIDIALDPFPWGGGTTTCDALWMGVPVITLAGQTPVSRSGLSLLSSAGMPELAADSVGRYIEIAIELATKPADLANRRQLIRQQMIGSRLMDLPRFVRQVEAAYLQMWNGRRMRAASP